MATGKSTWKYNKLLTGRRNYFWIGGPTNGSMIQRGVAANNPGFAPEIQGIAGVYGTPTTPNTPETTSYLQQANLGNTGTSGNSSGNMGSSINVGGLAGAAMADLTKMTERIQAKDVKSQGKAMKANDNASMVGLQPIDDNFDAFISRVKSTPYLSMATRDDFNYAGTGAVIGDALMEGLEGSMSGFGFANGGNLHKANKYAGGGPVGAIVGGVMGTTTSLIGNLIRNHQIDKTLKDVNANRGYINNWRDRSFVNMGNNLNNNQISNLEANYIKAFGGPIDGWDGAIGYSFMNDWLNNKREEAENKGSNYNILPRVSTFAEGGKIHIKPSKRGTFTAAASKHDMGVQEFASKVLANKEDYSPAMVKKANFAKNASKWHHALGGNLMTHGADWDTGLNYIANGGSHESSPYEGVPMGVDQEGTPNLVEEGETIWNDYVFSRRLMVPKFFRKKYKLGGNLSFADASLKLAKESEERPNDPISANGLEALMSDLAQTQEEVKAKKEQREMGMFANGGKVNKFEGLSTPSSNLNDPYYNQLMELGLNSLGDFYLNNILASNINSVSPYDLSTFLQYVNRYNGSMTNSQTAGSYGIDRGFFTGNNPYIFGSTNINDLEDTKEYQAFTDAVIANPNMYMDYLRMLDNRTAPTAKKLIDPKTGKLVQDWDKIFYKRRTDKDAGVYHMTPLMAEAISSDSVTTPAGTVKAEKGVKKAVEKAKEDGYIFKDNGQWRRWTPEMGDDPRIALMNKGYHEYDNKINTTGGTDYYFDLDQEIPKGRFQDWLRFAPVAGFGIGALANLFSKPDYSNANAILEASKNIGQYQPVSFNPIGNYLAYRPFDREFYINQQNAQAGATRRALANSAGQNRGALMAGLLAADNNYINGIGNLARQAEEYNLAQRQQVEDFNRKTDMFNSEGIFQADAANQKARMQSGELSLKGTLAAANMRQNISDQKDAALAANMSGLFQTLGDIGREEYDYRMLNPLIQREIFGRGIAGDYGRITAKGGKLKRRKKGFTV